MVDLLVLERPNQIIVVDRNINKKKSNVKDAQDKFPAMKLFQFSVANHGRFKKIIKKFNIEVVFHLAALSLVESLFRPKKVVLTNLRMVINLLELQRQKLFKTLILISSSEAYGSASFIPINEEHPLNPTTPYASSKAATDLIALSYYKTFGNDLAIVRPFNNYGPRQNPVYKGIITHTIQALLSNREPIIYGTGNQTRDYIFVKDTVRGIIEAYNHHSTRGRIINLGSGESIKIKDLVSKLIKISGKKVSIKFEKSRVADVKNHCADIGLARKLMGWYPKFGLNDGLKETYEWYKRLAVK